MKEDLTRSVPQTQKITLGEKADTGRKLGFKSNVADAATDQTGLRRQEREAERKVEREVVESFARDRLSIRHKGQGWPVCGGAHLKYQHLGGETGRLGVILWATQPIQGHPGTRLRTTRKPSSATA